MGGGEEWEDSANQEIFGTDAQRRLMRKMYGSLNRSGDFYEIVWGSASQRLPGDGRCTACTC